jgi:steroid 5-alpha reductase family enzyme
MLEHGLKKRRAGYEEYIRKTSSFVPWWPKG